MDFFDIQAYCPFLKALPTELRNMIYEHIVQPVHISYAPYHFWIVKGPNPRGPPEPSSWPVRCDNYVYQHKWTSSHRAWDSPQFLMGTSFHDVIPAITSRRRHVQGKRGSGKPRGTLDPVAELVCASLLFVCRQTYVEFAPMFYSRVMFGFGSAKRLAACLNVDDQNERYFHLPRPSMTRYMFAPKLHIISTLQLQCNEYGAPELNHLRTIQVAYYNSWNHACRRIVKKMTGLRDLSVWIYVPLEPPIRLSLTDMWFTPFLQLKDCKSLENVKVWIDGPKDRIRQAVMYTMSEVVQRVISGWEEEAALSAITDAKQEAMLLLGAGESRELRSLISDYSFMEYTNGIGRQ